MVNTAQQNLDKITQTNEKISQLVEAIAQATAVQSQASETVTQSMLHATTLTHKTSEEANQVSLSFKQLRKAAQILQQEVEQFKVS